MGKWTATVTNKGYALQAKLLSTDKLNITRVVSGSGSCSATQLINQTAVTDIKQELTVDSLSYDKYGNARLKVTLSNKNLSTGYAVRQVGVYATDPDEGEILYAITQADEAENIPSISEQPNGFDCSWDFALTYSNAQNVNVTIDPSNAISQETADKRYVQLSNIGANLSVDENGVLSANAQEITVDTSLSSSSTNPVQNKVVYEAIKDSKYTLPKASASTLGGVKVGKGLTVDTDGTLSATGTDVTIDSALSSTSTNPVQNKVVNTALRTKVDKESGKGLSTNDYTTTEKSKLAGIAEGANNYSLPKASASTLGGVKVGSGLTVDSDGTLSATGTDVTIDSAMSSSSTNPVQNKVVNSALSNKVDKESGKGLSTNDYTTTEKNKLSGIAEGANNYTHPAYTAKESGLYKVTVDSTGHVSGATPVTKSDITDLGIPSSDTKYTHPSYTAKTSGLYKVTVDSTGHVSGATAVTKEDITALGIPASDTYNTTSSTDTDKKIYLIGAVAQYAEGVGTPTYSHDTAYVGKDGCLYSNSTKVSVEGHTHPELDSSLKPISNTIGNTTYGNVGAQTSTHLTIGTRDTSSSAYPLRSLSVGTGNDFAGYDANNLIGTATDSAAIGYYLEAHARQFVCGKYNNLCNAPEISSSNDIDAVFYVGCGTSDSSRQNAFRVSSNGKCRGTQSFGSSGADYAEYLEWEDGNPNNEDRRGRMVAYALTDVECTVEDVEILHPDTHEPITVKAIVYEKMPTIRYANSFDECIGVVSGSASFIGNTASEEWNVRFLRDVYGERIMQAVLIPEKTETYEVKEIDEKTGEEVMVEKTKVTPEHWAKQFVLNPHYDPEKEYVSRELRKEWDPVGMVGMVVVEDDGTCVVGGYCKPSTNGVGTAAETGYRVLQRMDNTHVRVLVK